MSMKEPDECAMKKHVGESTSLLLLLGSLVSETRAIFMLTAKRHGPAILATSPSLLLVDTYPGREHLCTHHHHQ